MRIPLPPPRLARSIAQFASLGAGLAASALLGACADRAPTGPPRAPASLAAGHAAVTADLQRSLATLRRVTARYHDINLAIHDGFVPVRPGCSEEEGGEIMPIPYAHIGRLTDGKLDASEPDALLYEPMANGRMKLVGVELAIPYAQWSGTTPPTFFGATFQEENELGVYGLHIWVWEHNPEGMFAEGNPRVTCGAD